MHTKVVSNDLFEGLGSFNTLFNPMYDIISINSWTFFQFMEKPIYSNYFAWLIKYKTCNLKTTSASHTLAHYLVMNTFFTSLTSHLIVSILSLLLLTSVLFKHSFIFSTLISSFRKRKKALPPKWKSKVKQNLPFHVYSFSTFWASSNSMPFCFQTYSLRILSHPFCPFSFIELISAQH